MDFIEPEVSVEPISTLKTTSVPLKTPKKKRTERHIELWKKNVRKNLCQSGKSYVDVRGNLREARKIKITKDCETKCRFKCAIKISPEKRKNIHLEFWELNDNQKLIFYDKNVERSNKLHTKVSSESRRSFTYFFYFHVDDVKIRVCKDFFLSTLDISHRRISYFFQYKKSPISLIPMMYERGKHTKKSIKEEYKDIVRNHINSFPRIKAEPSDESGVEGYLHPGLNMKQMHNLYLKMCTENDYTPVKEHMYRQIFKTEFNLGFTVVNKDGTTYFHEVQKIDKDKDTASISITSLSEAIYQKFLSLDQINTNS